MGKKQDLISKKTRAKSAGGVAQAVESLSSKCEALSSTPPVPPKRKKAEGFFGLCFIRIYFLYGGNHCDNSK
jgi:hypothetical protein